MEKRFGLRILLFYIFLPYLISLNNFYYLNSTYLSYCNRFLNDDGQVGCSSQPEGSYGILKLLLNDEDVDSFVKETLLDDYVVLVNYKVFSDKYTMNELKKKPRIAGVIITNNSDKRDDYYLSENSKCPNSVNSLYPNQCTEDFVLNATSFAYEDWPFPIVHLKGDNRLHLAELKRCNDEFNIKPFDDTRCSIEISNFMEGIGDSETCIRRSLAVLNNMLIDDNNMYCQEADLSSTYVHGKSHYTVAPRPPKSTLLVITRVDAKSMFEKSGFGQKGVAVGASIILSVVQNFYQNEHVKNSTAGLTHDVTFGFIDSDELDYLGSENLLNEIRNGKIAVNTAAPLSLDAISAVIEVGLVGMPLSGKKLFMITDSETYKDHKSDIDALREDLKKAGEKNGITFEISKRDMLPTLASVQTFLRKRRDINHILITDSEGTFKDPMFDSIFDDNIDEIRLKPAFMSQIADALLTLVLRKVTNIPTYVPPKITEWSPIEFLECFQNDQICSLFVELMPPLELANLKELMQPISMQHYSINLPEVDFVASKLISRILIYLTGREFKPADGNCPTLTNKGPFYYHSISTSKGTVCYQTNVELNQNSHSSSISPRWIRSSVKSKFVRYYRSSSGLIDLITFIIGLVFTIVIVIVLIIFKYYIRIGDDNCELSPNPPNTAEGTPDDASSVPSTSETT